MINEELKSTVAVRMLQLGVSSLTYLTSKVSGGLPRDIEACLHSLALEGLVKVKATYMRRGKRIFAFVYWQHTDYEGSYREIRDQQAEKLSEKFPELFNASRKRAPRLLIVDNVRRFMEEDPNAEWSANDLREALGVSYGKANQALKQLAEEGVVKARKEIYGRGRPRIKYTAVNGKNPEPEKQVWSFDDDPEAVDLE